MAEVFAFFPVQRTMCNMTFYMMEGRNFVRKKSSLTRRKVLYSPQFERTRQNAAVMAQASKIGSYLFNSLPVQWRQSWMYRSFTGEAYSMLKKGKGIMEVRQFLWHRYIQEVIAKHTDVKQSLPEPSTKRAYKKHNTHYWEAKTQKKTQNKAREQQRQRNADLLAEASAIASALYRELPPKSRKRSHYQKLTGWAMRWLKNQEDTAMARTSLELPPGYTKQPNEQSNTDTLAYINCKNGTFYFKLRSHNRLFFKKPKSFSSAFNCKYWAINSAFDVFAPP